MSKLWVVAALCVAAANVVSAAEIEVVWDGKVRRVEVDGAYSASHPAQKGLQAVVAGDLRPSVRNLETRVADHEGRITALEQNPPASQEENVENPGASAPSQKGGGRMNTVPIIVLFILMVAILAAIMIGMWCGFFRPLTGKRGGGSGPAQIPPQPGTPQASGDSGGESAGYRYDEAGRVTDWRRDYWPVQPATQPPAPPQPAAPAPVPQPAPQPAAQPAQAVVIPPPPPATGPANP